MEVISSSRKLLYFLSFFFLYILLTLEFLVLVNQILSATIGNIVLSDHTPVDITNSCSLKRYSNNSLLNNEGYCEYIRTVIKEFREFNEGSIDDVVIIIISFFIRGCLIQYSSLIKLLKLEQDIKELEKQH